MPDVLNIHKIPACNRIRGKTADGFKIQVKLQKIENHAIVPLNQVASYATAGDRVLLECRSPGITPD